MASTQVLADRLWLSRLSGRSKNRRPFSVPGSGEPNRSPRMRGTTKPMSRSAAASSAP
ncbi:hypothetical protein [Streptomyces sp. NPDC017949]|uniref:hypothetical protein n=1 Tax=Streptomyces sp. NPDC017949 TaxID=3365020 RepID=UPI00379DC91A